MCGRFLLATPASTVAEVFDLDEVPILQPRYNIAPGQPVAIVRHVPSSTRRELTHVLWGMIPSWSRDPASAGRPINARAETAADKPTFRAAFRRRRCLVPADGFYEWKPLGGRRKQPFVFRLGNGEPFAFAGLWEVWEGPQGEVLETGCILTTEANDLVRPVHDRMPVILPVGAHAAWLGPNRGRPELERLLVPFPAEQMTAVPVGLWVGDPRHEGPRCLEHEGALFPGGA
jgi:putative SOS response-associated peptidase YedK